MHRKFLYNLKLFFKTFFFFFNKLFKLEGFFLDARGKLSVSGNAKRRHYFIREGLLSKSKKTLNFFFGQNQIRTKTGVVGMNYLITY